MAKNDHRVAGWHLDQRIADGIPSTERDEKSLSISHLEQVLKDYDLSREEIESGWVDGKDDGGLDGFLPSLTVIFYGIPRIFPGQSAML